MKGPGTRVMEVKTGVLKRLNLCYFPMIINHQGLIRPIPPHGFSSANLGRCQRETGELYREKMQFPPVSTTNSLLSIESFLLKFSGFYRVLISQKKLTPNIHDYVS